MREFLPSAVYGLWPRTKAATARRGYKYVWVRAGEICVRYSDRASIVLVRLAPDLERLELLEPVRRISIGHADPVFSSSFLPSEPVLRSVEPIVSVSRFVNGLNWNVSLNCLEIAQLNANSPSRFPILLHWFCIGHLAPYWYIQRYRSLGWLFIDPKR